MQTRILAASWRLVSAALVGCVLSFSTVSIAQPQQQPQQQQRIGEPSGAGWRYSPKEHGMHRIGKVFPMKGCAVGLHPTTTTDEPLSLPYWCGPPPYCLTHSSLAEGSNCIMLQYSRREPRYDPNGRPGINPVRDPEDLRCVSTGLMPIGGRCPSSSSVSLGATVNGQQHGTEVRVGQNVTLEITSSGYTQLSMSCTGLNAQIAPFNQTNLTAHIEKTHAFNPVAAPFEGMTTCTITGTNPLGTATTQTSFRTTTAPVLPTVTASFDPTNPVAHHGRVELKTSTTNATSLVWSCTGKWNVKDRKRKVGKNVKTNHDVTGKPGRTDCTFTATGPGGTATTTASWTSVLEGTPESETPLTPTNNWTPGPNTILVNECGEDTGQRTNSPTMWYRRDDSTNRFEFKDHWDRVCVSHANATHNYNTSTRGCQHQFEAHIYYPKRVIRGITVKQRHPLSFNQVCSGDTY